MTNTPPPILLLAHFCEIHGPQTILCTRLYPPSTPAGTTETGSSCANCSYSVPNTTTTPVLRSQTPTHVLLSSRSTSDALLRETCIRALSVETPGKGQLAGGFVTTTENRVYGCAEERNTNVVHVFRVQDPRARGQKRVYAFVAVGTAALLRWQGVLLGVFEGWGRSIEEGAERALRVFREQNGGGGGGGGGSAALGGLNGVNGGGGGGGGTASPGGKGDEAEGWASLSSSMDFTSATPSPPLSIETPLESSSPDRFPSPGLRGQRGGGAGLGGIGSAFLPSAAAAATNVAAQKNVTPVSSFLSAKTVDPDGYPRSANGLAGWTNLSKTRNLAEIVGDEYFFVRLHSEFCSLMERLVKKVEPGDNGLDGEDDGGDAVDGDEDDHLSGSGDEHGSGSGRLGSGSDDAEEAVVESDEEDEGAPRFGLDSEEITGKWRIGG